MSCSHNCNSCTWREWSDEMNTHVCGHPNFPEEDYTCSDDVEDCFFWEEVELPEDY